MIGKYSISKRERFLLLSFSFVAFALFAVGIFSEAIQAYNFSVIEHQRELARRSGAKDIISFAACGGLDYGIALFNLMVLPVFLSLIRPGKYVLSTVLTLLYATVLTLSVLSRLDGRGGLGSENFFTDPWYELWMKTSIDDYFAGFVIAVLLIWQGSILLRFLLGNRWSLNLR